MFMKSTTNVQSLSLWLFIFFLLLSLAYIHGHKSSIIFRNLLFELNKEVTELYKEISFILGLLLNS